MYHVIRAMVRVRLFVVVQFLAAAALACAAPIPVIYDTDIGTDFDDSVAVALGLVLPDTEIKLILTATNDTTARARIVAKFLTAVGRTDVPIGIGLPTQNATGQALYGWASSFNLSSYGGTVYTDGIGAAIAIIKASPVPVAIIAIAPATNFPAMLSRDPSIINNAYVVAMSGSVYRGYSNSTTPAAEYNVAVSPYASMAMYTAGWNVTTTPLDTCGVAALSGTVYNTWLAGSSRVNALLVECYLYWCVNGWWNPKQGGDIWYDAVAAYMALTPEAAAGFLDYEDMRLRVTPDGYTVPDDAAGSPVRVALTWAGGWDVGLPAWEHWAADTLGGGA